VIGAWKALIGDDWDDVRRRSLRPVLRRELGMLLLGFVQWHTETRLRAFALLPSVAAAEA
jgi:hypothetical protein